MRLLRLRVPYLSNSFVSKKITLGNREENVVFLAGYCCYLFLSN